MIESTDEGADGKQSLPDDERRRPHAGSPGGRPDGGNATGLAVSTGVAAPIDGSSVTLEGSLDVLSGAGVEVVFEYRPVDDGEWTATDPQVRSKPCTFDRIVDGLSPATVYEFRATARAGDATRTGSVASFATPAEPVVGRLEVREAGFPNPNAEITVEWGVAGAVESLSTVLVEVFEGSEVLDAVTSDLSGDDATGVDHFRIEAGAGKTFEVKVTVVDAAGTTTSTTTRVRARSV